MTLWPRHVYLHQCGILLPPSGLLAHIYVCIVSVLPRGGTGSHTCQVVGAHLSTHTHTCIAPEPPCGCAGHPCSCACHVQVLAYGSISMSVHMLGTPQRHHMAAWVCLFAYLQCPGLPIACVGTPFYMADCPRAIKFRHGIVPEPRVLGMIVHMPTTPLYQRVAARAHL